MLRSIELVNFLSHGDNTISLNPGITVFMGHNGSGKSSVIDGLTFALFGKHTRPNNKELVKYGESKGQASVEFSINGKDYKATRNLTAKGALTARFYDITDGKEDLIAEGERTQLGNDTMSNAIESTIGLDFEKIKIASIVQQGELEKIIKAKPKEFKELLNSIITIDKLDDANTAMKEVREQFRTHVKSEFGYDDEDMDIVSKNISDFEKDIEESEPLIEKLELEKTEKEKIISELKQKIEKLQAQESMINQLETRKTEMFEYARQKIVDIGDKNEEIEGKIQECEHSFSIISNSGELESQIQEGKTELDKIAKDILEFSNKQSKLDANVSLAEKLKLKDGKCPVCDSEVDHLNEIFQIEHIKHETNLIRDSIIKLEQKQNKIEQKNVELERTVEEQRDAKATLKANNVNDKSDVTKLKEELESGIKHCDIVSNSLKTKQIVQLASIDTHAKQLSENISRLEEQTQGFDQKILSNLKDELYSNQDSLRQIDTNYGATTARLDSAKKGLEESTSVLKELEIARE